MVGSVAVKFNNYNAIARALVSTTMLKKRLLGTFSTMPRGIFRLIFRHMYTCIRVWMVGSRYPVLRLRQIKQFLAQMVDKFTSLITD